MSRTIDRVIDLIENLDSTGGLSPTIKRVLVNRITVEPTQDELNQAHNELYPDLARPYGQRQLPRQRRTVEEIESTPPDD